MRALRISWLVAMAFAGAIFGVSLQTVVMPSIMVGLVAIALFVVGALAIKSSDSMADVVYYIMGCLALVGGTAAGLIFAMVYPSFVQDKALVGKMLGAPFFIAGVVMMWSIKYMPRRNTDRTIGGVSRSGGGSTN